MASSTTQRPPGMTYDILVQDLQEYWERTDTDFVLQIPRLIYLAEQTIAAAVKTLWETTVVVTSVNSGDSYFPKPARWRKTLSMKVKPANAAINAGTPMLIRDQTYVSMVQSESDNGQPQLYADWDYDNWIIAPVPDQTYNIEIVYQGLLQPLSSQNQQNLLTREFPQLLLYASMMHCAVYLKANEKFSLWQGLLDKELQTATGEDNVRLIDSNTKREQK